MTVFLYSSVPASNQSNVFSLFPRELDATVIVEHFADIILIPNFSLLVKTIEKILTTRVDKNTSLNFRATPFDIRSASVFRLLDAECRKNKELKREIASVQKILESLNQQLESERTEKSSLAAEVEMNTSRHSAEVARIKQSCEREAAEQVEKTIFEVSSRYESKMKEDKMLHEQHIRVIEVDFKDKVEARF